MLSLRFYSCWQLQNLAEKVFSIVILQYLSAQTENLLKINIVDAFSNAIIFGYTVTLGYTIQFKTQLTNGAVCGIFREFAF